MSKLNVMGWFDYCCSTGFGQVSQNLIKVLNDTNKYNFNIIGINYDGTHYDKNKWIGEVDPATNFLRQFTDVYGRPTLLNKLSTEPVDILFIIQDTFLVQTVMDKILEIRSKLPKERQFVIIYYFPIDGAPKKSWIEGSSLKVDFPVTYTEYAKQECYKALGMEFPLDIIYHGTNKTNFCVLKQEDVDFFKKQNFPDHYNDFFVLNVNRNQPRKDLYRSLAAFKVFHDKYPKSFYFLNCQANDVGGNIQEIAKGLGLELYKDYSFPSTDIFNASQGLPIEVVNQFYNIADVVISSTIGEGWGLSVTESMATKTPVIFPRNTSLVEIIGENEERGYLCDSGNDVEHFICLGANDNDIIRPLISVQSMADKLEQVYLNREEAIAKAELAYAWVPAWRDKSIGGKWLDVFRRAENKLKLMRNEQEAGTKPKEIKEKKELSNGAKLFLIKSIAKANADSEALT